MVDQGPIAQFHSRIPVQKLGGLRPRAWLCVGAGYSREDIKALLLGGGTGFTADAVTNLQSICLKILSASAPEAGLGAHRLLGSLARQEVLRMLLAEARISARMPELKRLRRQGGFYRRLDFAMQAGRMAFAHAEEGAVYSERLAARSGPNPVRAEIEALSVAYEAWLEGSALLDPPMLIRKTTTVLLENAWPETLLRPEEIHYFSAQTEESLERLFWDALSRHVPLLRSGPIHESPRLPAAEDVEGEAEVAAENAWDWQLWHTLDDAADALAEQFASEGDEAFDGTVVLIPDSSSARRSLRRALDSRGIPLSDPRDPTRLRWDEGIKWAILPLETVARGFERQKTVSYLRAHLMQKELPAWVTEIHARGIRHGLASYAGGLLSQPHSFLGELNEFFGGRKTCAELAENHLKLLRSSVGTRADRLWIVPFFEGLWKEFVEDTELIGQGGRRAPLLYWWERLQSRLAETPAPVERAKPEKGVAVYRLHQAPLVSPRRVFVLGLPSDWLGGEGVGDYWLSERDREALSGEFAVRSGIQTRQERLAALASWLSGAGTVQFLDAAFDPDGRERESIEAVIREAANALALPAEMLPEAPVEKGAHPRWVPSYGALRPLQPQCAELSPLAPQPGARAPEITATALDSYSRCGMQALAYHRWRLKETRDPDAEAWPEARGNILHEAVKLLLESRDAEGNLTLALQDALDRAWALKPPRGSS